MTFEPQPEQFKQTTYEQYEAGFRQIESAIQKNVIQKAILSRTQIVPCKANPLELFHALNQTYTSTFNYLFQLEGEDCWLAATPELLVERNSTTVSSMSLAGTKPADGQSQWTKKEEDEQELVTRRIQEAYIQCGYESIQTQGPETVRSGFVEHLLTTISATDSSEKNFRQLLNELHPTPAVGGLPSLAAQSIIQTAETHDREWYTGFVGIAEQEQEMYFVNLRCMKLRSREALLYLGGGITSESVLMSEWEETENKARTLTSVIQSK